MGRSLENTGFKTENEIRRFATEKGFPPVNSNRNNALRFARDLASEDWD